MIFGCLHKNVIKTYYNKIVILNAVFCYDTIKRTKRKYKKILSFKAQYVIMILII